MEYILPMCNLQSIEDGLLHAISRDNVHMCELILDHPLYKKNRIQLSSSDGFYQKDTESPRMRPNIAPIVLAAQRNNFYMVQLLILKGAHIAPPHDYFCDCVECSNMRMFDSVKYSRSRLNIYRALVSPAYISLSSDDPILTAFSLSNELAQLAEIEKEYKVGNTIYFYKVLLSKIHVVCSKLKTILFCEEWEVFKHTNNGDKKSQNPIANRKIYVLIY